jgi:O-methyltransferase
LVRNYFLAVIAGSKNSIPVPVGFLKKIKTLVHGADSPEEIRATAEGAPNVSGVFGDLGKTNLALRPILEMLPTESSAAFSRLNEIKAGRQPVEDVDFLRAFIFQSKAQPYAAIEALKEELRYFPLNTRARVALEQLQKQISTDGPQAGEPEFLGFLEVIRPYTMVGEPRLFSLYNLARKVCEQNITGNVVECGVAAGGTSALLAATVQAHGEQARKIFSFDTFEGMPAASALDTHEGQHAEATGWGAGTCAAPMDSLLELAGKLQVRELIQPVKGLFAETLPQHKQFIGPIALLHVDGDWYSSTMDVLGNLYDQVVPGGYVQVDDYGFWEGCKRAVTEFQEKRGLTFDLQTIDSTGVWFQKK